MLNQEGVDAVHSLLSASLAFTIKIAKWHTPKMDDQKQRGRRLIAKNTIFNLTGQILPMVAGILTIPFIVRGLGAAEYGILSIAMMLLGYFNIFDLGLSRATVKFVAENLDPENIHKVPELIWTSLSLLVGLGIIGGAVAALSFPSLSLISSKCLLSWRGKRVLPFLSSVPRCRLCWATMLCVVYSRPRSALTW